MADPMTGPITRCPWCSAELSIPGAERCLACGAALVSPTGGPDLEIKGVTMLDPEAILRARADVARPKSRIFSFITGEAPPETGGPASPESLARPPADVRREMLRLELEAQQAEATAETVALKSDVLARRGIHVSQLGGESATAPTPEADAVPEAPVPGDATAEAGGVERSEGPADEAVPEASDEPTPRAEDERGA
jgi:hypothetical protein